MMSYYVELSFDLGKPSDPARFEEHLECVAEGFVGLDGGITADIGVDMESGVVDLCMTLTAADHIAAISQAVTAARTAVHCAGGSTPGWEQMLSEMLDSASYSSRVQPGELAPLY